MKPANFLHGLLILFVLVTNFGKDGSETRSRTPRITVTLFGWGKAPSGPNADDAIIIDGYFAIYLCCLLFTILLLCLADGSKRAPKVKPDEENIKLEIRVSPEESKALQIMEDRRAQKLIELRQDLDNLWEKIEQRNEPSGSI